MIKMKWIEIKQKKDTVESKNSSLCRQQHGQTTDSKINTTRLTLNKWKVNIYRSNKHTQTYTQTTFNILEVRGLHREIKEGGKDSRREGASQTHWRSTHHHNSSCPSSRIIVPGSRSEVERVRGAVRSAPPLA